MNIKIELEEYDDSLRTGKKLSLKPMEYNKVFLQITDDLEDNNRCLAIELNIFELQKALSKLAL